MTAHSGPGWQLAAALIELERQANTLAPGRNKASDGSIGDQSHANRNSAHNSKPFVHALDLTHDPAGGFDARKFEEALAAACIAGESRIEGIGGYNTATNSERWFAYRDGVWSWIDQDLHGASHKTHVHVEVNELADHDARPFDLAEQTPPQLPQPNTTEDDDMAEHYFTNDNGAVHWWTGSRLVPLNNAEMRGAIDASRKAQGLPALVPQPVKDKRFFDSAHLG